MQPETEGFQWINLCQLSISLYQSIITAPLSWHIEVFQINFKLNEENKYFIEQVLLDNSTQLLNGNTIKM